MQFFQDMVEVELVEELMGDLVVKLVGIRGTSGSLFFSSIKILARVNKNLSWLGAFGNGLW